MRCGAVEDTPHTFVSIGAAGKFSARRSDTPKQLCGCRCIPFIELPEVLFVLQNRGEGFDCRPPQLCPVVAGASPTISGEFFVPFFVLEMNHEHKE